MFSHPPVIEESGHRHYGQEAPTHSIILIMTPSWNFLVVFDRWILLMPLILPLARYQVAPPQGTFLIMTPS
jgi:hypothetical protein